MKKDIGRNFYSQKVLTFCSSPVKKKDDEQNGIFQCTFIGFFWLHIFQWMYTSSKLTFKASFVVGGAS